MNASAIKTYAVKAYDEVSNDKEYSDSTAWLQIGAKLVVAIVLAIIALASMQAKAGTEVAVIPVVQVTETQLIPGVTTANEDAVALLMAKLNERDLTVQELQKLNLDLQVENLSLKEINAKLRKQLAAKTKEIKKMKAEYQKAAEGAYKNAIMQIKSIVNMF